MKNQLNEFLHYRALAAKHENAQVFARIIDAATDIPQTRQIATVVASELVDELDELLAILSMTKRQFMEMAIIDAMEQANFILECHGVDAYHEAQAARAEGGAK